MNELTPDPEIEEFAIQHKKNYQRRRPIPSVCEECLAPFDSKTQLDSHLRTEHPIEPVFNDAKRDEFLKLLRQNVRYFKACRAVGISPATVKRAEKVDPTFSEAVALAEEEAAEKAEELLWEQAEGGNMSAIVKILDKRQEKRWAANPQVVEVKVSGQIEHTADRELLAHQRKVIELGARARERMALNGTAENDQIIDAEIVE